MAGIPSVLESDAEDVAWALQTAEALWKRNERVDAIVWLRRAAQAAGEAEDDDRALALAREAAELAEWLAQNPQPTESRSSPPRPSSNAPAAADAVDDLLRTSQTNEVEPAAGADATDEIDVRVSELPVESIPMESVQGEDLTIPIRTAPAAAPPPAPAPAPPLPPPAPPPPPAALRASMAPRPASLPPITPPPRPKTPTPAIAEDEAPTADRGTVVPTAAEKHAGMLDPWAEHEAPTV
ncbi:MAG TPA: hypothetical protein VIY73_04380, partial [Polyangiaceae bacterium]